jgi:hypothetical protein
MLRDEMQRQGIDEDQLLVWEVVTDEDAVRLGFPGSPTIRVDGVDVQDPGGQPTGLTCRLYHKRDGRPSPLPDAADVRDALAASDAAGRQAG